MQRYLIATTLLVLSTTLVAADRIELYKQAYRQAMTDKIGVRLSNEFRKQGLTDEQIDRNIAYIVNGMANCQVSMLQNYDQRYSDLAYTVTANGGSLGESNAQLEEQMHSDIASGAISEERLTKMVASGVEFVQDCTARLFNK